jgi:outer membrane immunogenic protein
MLALSLSLCATTAFAADAVYVDPPMEAPPPVGDWTGFYAGVQLGGAFGSTGQAQLSPFAFPGLVTAFTPAGQVPGSSFNANGDFNDSIIGGGHVGYDWQFDRIVVGGVLDFNFTNVNDEQRAFSRSPADYVITRDLDFLATLRGRVGYLFTDNLLAYATGGLAYGDVDISYRQGPLSPAVFNTSGGQDSDFGYTVGGGLEAKLTQQVSIGVEYLYTNLGGNDFQANLSNGPFGGAGGAVGSNAGGTTLTGTDSDFDFHTVQVKLSYRF